MDSNNGETGSIQQDEPEVPIKEETLAHACQPIITTDPGEIIDLLSDNGQDESLMQDVPEDAIETRPADDPSPGINIDENVENEDTGPTHDQLIAAAHNMATKYKTQKKPAKADAGTRFQEAKKAYQKKKKANKLSIEEEIEFMKMESDEMARIRKQEADDEFDRSPSSPEDDEEGSEGLFVTEPRIPRFSDNHSDDEAPSRTKRKRYIDSDNEMPARKKRGPAKVQTSKKTKKVAGTNYNENDFEDVISRARQQSAANANPKTTAKGKGNAKKPALSKVKTRGAKASGPNMLNLDSIFGNDVFGDTAKTAGLAAQPTFSIDNKRRDNALKQLIASVPVEKESVAKADKKYMDEAMKDFTGHASVGPASDGNWFVKGMRTTLRHYQLLGTAFMRRRENDSHEPRGGILADEMGLGKTVMMLANIVNGKPKDKGKMKTTLIVASPALVMQWDQEIRTHCQSRFESKQHGIGTVIQYRAGNRISSNDPVGVLQSADVVLTTWHEVGRSYPKAVIPPNLVTAVQKDAFWKGLYERERGILHRVKFLRVVLDEAQAIKNHQSHTSMACRALDSRHHWAITGTPIMNTIKEFYPYFKFLREPNTGSFKIFKENFCSPDDPDGREKLNVFLRKFMIRRTHIDTLFGAKLLDLPQPKETTLWLEFNDVERQIYEIVKQRFIAHINKISSKNELQKQYGHIWSMILRLRQLCGHVLLIQETFFDLCEREDFEKLNKITESENEMTEEGAALLVHLRNVLRNSEGLKTVDSGLGSGTLTEYEALATGVVDIDNTEGEVGGNYGLQFRFRKYLDNLRSSEAWDAVVERSTCCGCRQIPQDPQVTSCFHVYCLTCLNDLQHYAAKRGYDRARCNECGEEYATSQPCAQALERTEAARETSLSSAGLQINQKSAKAARKNDMGSWLDMKGEVLPSAKTRATKAQILEWLAEDPDAKIIVYSQWRSMIDIVSRLCKSEKWDFCLYHGGMSHESRDKAISEFKERPEKKILLASLRAGGLGLNLTMASRVICLDSWWNQATEQQAFCRVFRIGQTKETRMTRFAVTNTVDAAMMQLKERKNIEIDQVMNNSKMKQKLSVEDLMRLFGNVREDDEGKPFIFAEGPDQYDDNEHLRLANIDREDEEQFMGNEE